MEDFGVEGPLGALGPSGWGEREGLQGVLGPDFDWASVSEALYQLQEAVYSLMPALPIAYTQPPLFPTALRAL